MIDLGKKRGGAMEATVGPSKPYVSYPSMTLEKKSLPFLKGKDVDDTFILTVKCKITSINKYNDGDTNYGIDLIAAEEGKDKSDE